MSAFGPHPFVNLARLAAFAVVALVVFVCAAVWVAGRSTEPSVADQFLIAGCRAFHDQYRAHPEYIQDADAQHYINLCKEHGL
jgi:hypothetical protein